MQDCHAYTLIIKPTNLFGLRVPILGCRDFNVPRALTIHEVLFIPESPMGDFPLPGSQIPPANHTKRTK